jgi:vanillate O-demethylase ferredoxin subunit
MGELELKLLVDQVVEEAEGIRRYELRRSGGRALPRFEAGAHVDVEVPGGLLRSYSLCNDPAEENRYVIAVQREAAGRGGSTAFHTKVTSGQNLLVSAPRNAFSLVESPRTLLIAGGIGITPLLSMFHQLKRERRDFELHYCSRNPKRTAFRELLGARELAGSVFFHHDNGDPSRGVDLRALLASQPEGTHVYCCGPKGLMDAVRTASAGWPSGRVHFESFTAPQGVEDTDFEVRLSRSGRTLQVRRDQTLLAALREAGVEVDSGCEAGACGTCITPLLEGRADHRDTCLTPAEREKSLCPCVSRARGSALTLDL